MHPPLSRLDAYQEIPPKSSPSIDALTVAKWGFIELVMVVLLVGLFRSLNRQRQSRNA
ncbi:hypothetical protein ACO2Q8_26730 [Larkinella sp. VNQ87]|uniref:hypothetical protein n=1 Tax=Larkinella sp. VNQ87 TaxID=3400921 RepID=UPI003BFAC3D8